MENTNDGHIIKDESVYYITVLNGIAKCTYEKDTNTLVISNIEVDENHRKAGTGQKLLDLCINLSHTLNCESITLLVDKNNKFVLNWYIKNKFRVICNSCIENLIILNRNNTSNN